MRKFLPVVVSGALIALVLGVGPQAASAASAVIGQPLPGSVQDWGGPLQWASTDAVGLRADGYDPAAVGRPYTPGGQHDHVAVDVAPSGDRATVAVSDCCTNEISVPYALVDADGRVNVASSDAVLSIAGLAGELPPVAKASRQNAMMLAPRIRFDVQVGNSSSLRGTYDLDMASASVYHYSGNRGEVLSGVRKSVSAIVVQMTPDLVALINNTFVKSMYDGLFDGIHSLSYDHAMSYSFAVAFDAPITNGLSDVVSLAEGLDIGWLAGLNQSLSLSGRLLSELTWRDFTSPAIQLTLAGTAREAQLDAINV
ncbi:MAG: hypothetical protein LBH76_10975, partial [Propionibacteriaceae bacterium]|nr:hypothetical protein [Propionibacteriaceae bacterium]